MSKGRMAIYYAHSFDNDTIRVEITDDLARVRFLTVEMDPVTFSKMLMGRHEVECELELRGLNFIGMKAENKNEIVLCKPFKDSLAVKTRKMNQMEVDGWLGDVNDLKNHHNYRNNGVAVTFRRHVKYDPTS